MTQGLGRRTGLQETAHGEGPRRTTLPVFRVCVCGGTCRRGGCGAARAKLERKAMGGARGCVKLERGWGGAVDGRGGGRGPIHGQSMVDRQEAPKGEVVAAA